MAFGWDQAINAGGTLIGGALNAFGIGSGNKQAEEQREMDAWMHHDSQMENRRIYDKARGDFIADRSFDRQTHLADRSYAEDRYRIERDNTLRDRQTGLDQDYWQKDRNQKLDLSYNLANMKQKLDLGREHGMTPWDVMGQGSPVGGGGSGGGASGGPIAGAATAARGAAEAQQVAQSGRMRQVGAQMAQQQRIEQMRGYAATTAARMSSGATINAARMGAQAQLKGYTQQGINQLIDSRAKFAAAKAGAIGQGVSTLIQQNEKAGIDALNGLFGLNIDHDLGLSSQESHRLKLNREAQLAEQRSKTELFNTSAAEANAKRSGIEAGKHWWSKGMESGAISGLGGAALGYGAFRAGKGILSKYGYGSTPASSSSGGAFGKGVDNYDKWGRRHGIGPKPYTDPIKTKEGVDYKSRLRARDIGQSARKRLAPPRGKERLTQPKRLAPIDPKRSKQMLEHRVNSLLADMFSKSQGALPGGRAGKIIQTAPGYTKRMHKFISGVYEAYRKNPSAANAEALRRQLQRVIKNDKLPTTWRKNARQTLEQLEENWQRHAMQNWK